MRSEEQRPPLPAQAAEHRFHRYARYRVKAAHRLVEHVEVPLEAEARRETELLRHAFRERAHRPRERLALELELRGESADPRLVVALAAQRHLVERGDLAVALDERLDAHRRSLPHAR